MCGIAGFINLQHKTSISIEFLEKMTGALLHRGPDDSGHWIDPTAGIALGHRRLSIIDLSPAGHQPMHSANGRYVAVFNGEIYNFDRVRKAVEESAGSGIVWRGHSDTEVMLAAFEAWGVEEAVKRFIGMFAIALWDRQERRLHLIRDRIGEKPLYYGWQGNTFLFGSELKALRAHPAWRGEIDRDALALFLRFNYVPAPYSIYRGVHKLLPGHILTVSSSPRESNAVALKPYWSGRIAAEQGAAAPFRASEPDMIDQLDALLRDSIRQQMVADVPLGAFLSGGVDSSTIVALMQAQGSRPVKSFTIGFHEGDYNEAEHAKAVARHLGTEHTELYVTPADALAVIPKLPELYDEPFSDASQVPTFLVSQLTRKHVTVSLSGDAGDELFGGYSRYFLGRRVWNSIGWLPRFARSGAAALLTAPSPQTWESLLRILGPVLPARIRQKNPADKIQKLAEILSVPDAIEMYRGLVSHWKEASSIVRNASEPDTVLTDRSQWAHLSDFTSMMMYLDLVTYLPDDILVKVDRAAMGVSLETRVPFLDHRVVEFAWKVPLHMKVRDGQGKWLLRQVLYRYVPRELIDRPKTGFGVPIDSWLRGPLRDWAEGLLASDRLAREGFFDPLPIRQKWAEHLSGKRNWQYYLWDVLMFQAWQEQTRP